MCDVAPTWSLCNAVHFLPSVFYSTQDTKVRIRYKLIGLDISVFPVINGSRPLVLRSPYVTLLYFTLSYFTLVRRTRNWVVTSSPPVRRPTPDSDQTSSPTPNNR